jgi:hypothetical protein
MPAHSVRAVVERLHSVGLNLSLASTGGLAVAPSSQLTDDLCVLLRDSKALLINLVKAANDGSPSYEANVQRSLA